MLIRFAGAIALISGCTLLGLYYAAKEGYRISDLSEFKKALLILASEIEYMRTPLPQACINISTKTSGAISAMFEIFADYLGKNNSETAYRLWSKAAEETLQAAYLTAEDRQTVDSFGKTLGYLDKQMQKNAIDLAVSYIDEKTNALYAMQDKNTRMYRSLGVLGGLLLTVVLW